ncbi:MAG: Gfo/Idh/MocA family oxidoreductase [Phycisphaerales bacterium]|nr:MAG: Gfo/Idh/MocA family oxidoreductase [Phycisphaerales bacterium]
MATKKTENPDDQQGCPLSRRDFLKTSAVAAGATLATGCAGAPKSQTGPAVAASRKTPDTLRVGVIGTGGRGTGAAIDCVDSSPGVEIVALGDLFADRLDECRKRLADLGDKVKVTDDRCFAGFDAWQGVLSCDVDMVILAAPPAFRPLHLKGAIDAGKHVFMEKPVAVDPVGVRSVIASSEAAATKGLAIVAGTQRRHQPGYVETMKRIHDGAIGEVVAGQCYWNQGALWVKPKRPEWSDMEWQCRNWLYFTWLSGDHIVEQHVHNIDIINWAMKSPPVKAVGMGGRQVRTGPEYGNVYDHFSVEFEYPNGARVLSMCRQIEGSSHRVGERLVGTKGVADPSGTIQGEHPYKHEPQGEPVNPYVQEHTDLIASIRSGRPLNEGRRIAESTLTAIMGRMSAYTGRELSWNWALNASELDLTPPKFDMGDLPVAPVPMPGQTKLV